MNGFLWMALSVMYWGENPWIGHGLLLVKQADQHFEIITVTKTGSREEKFIGRPVSAGAGGLLFERQGTFYFKEHGRAEPRALPPPPAPALNVALPHVAAAAFLSSDQLHLFAADRWQNLAIPVWCEYVAEKPALSAQFGINLKFPMIFQWNHREIWAYQPSSGALHRFDLDGGKTRIDEIGVKLVPIPLKDSLLWINAPKKGRLGRNAATGGFHITDQLNLKHLDRHSLIYPVGDQCWLFTFDQGFRAALKSWDKGSVSLTAHYVETAGNRLKKKSFSLEDMPVRFQMETSAGGSPRLDIQPLFKFIPLLDESGLVLLKSDHYAMLSPVSGMSPPVPLPQGIGDPVGAVRRETGLIFINAAGQPVSEERFGP